MKNKKNEGFSLAGVIVAAGLLGALAVGVMQVMKNMADGQAFASSSADELELRTEIRLLLEDEKFCRISFAGNGSFGTPSSPVVFKKSDIDENDEGLDVELWLSNQAGDQRTKKKFSASDNAFKKFGKIQIDELKLIMNNGTGFNYAQSPGHNDIGELRLTIQKRATTSQSRTIKMNFAVRIGMSTDASGSSTILTCSRIGEAKMPKIASGQNVVGPDALSNQAVINLATYGFDPTGEDPHIIVSERDSNYVAADGNTMDASYCGFTKTAKLSFVVTCWASTNPSDSSVQSSFDWLAVQN